MGWNAVGGELEVAWVGRRSDVSTWPPELPIAISWLPVIKCELDTPGAGSMPDPDAEHLKTEGESPSFKAPPEVVWGDDQGGQMGNFRCEANSN